MKDSLTIDMVYYTNDMHLFGGIFLYGDRIWKFLQITWNS